MIVQVAIVVGALEAMQVDGEGKPGVAAHHVADDPKALQVQRTGEIADLAARKEAREPAQEAAHGWHLQARTASAALTAASLVGSE